MAHAHPEPHKHVETEITADTAHLDETDRRILSCLAESVRITNEIYLDQTNQDFAATGGAFDPSRGTNFYPEGVTKEELERFIARHPETRESLLSPFTIVERDGESFRAVPYSERYAPAYGRIAGLLCEAADICRYPLFEGFLRKRAEGLLAGKHEESDIAWIHANDAPFELIIGPYECYEDAVFGVKRDFQGVLGIVLPDETREAESYQDAIGRFDRWLGERYGYEARTALTPMRVVDQVVAGGNPWYGYTMMACNLPNERHLQEQVGSKKTFMRNIMRAKAELITRRIAEKVLGAGQAQLVEPATYLRFVVGHESAHGLSFRFSGEEFGTVHSELEEGKADVFGLLFLYFLAGEGSLEHEAADQAVIVHLVDGLRQIRFGLDEAHAVGTLIQYGWLMDAGVLRIEGGQLHFRPEGFGEALGSLGDALYALSQTKDEGKARAFLAKWGNPTPEIRGLIEGFDGIPVDIDPVFSI